MQMTAHQRQVLTTILKGGLGSDLAYARPGGWWLGTHPLDGKTGMWLLRNSLVSKTSGDEAMEYYSANGYTKKALDTPKWTIESEADHVPA
jgi:hypothetical protein